MKRLLVASITGLAVAACAAVALAQGTEGTTTWPSVVVKPTISPKTAGTRAHPQGVKLKTVFRWQTLGEADQPIVTNFYLLFPKGSLYNGAHTTKCSVRTLDLRGPGGCPKASIMGSGRGTAYADTTITHPQITVVNGGASTIYFYTVLNNPARVQEPVIGHIKKLHGKWAYSLSVTVPQNLRIVADVPIELTSLNVLAGKGTWLATTGCPRNHEWPFSVKTSYENPNLAPGAPGATGSASYSASVACRASHTTRHDTRHGRRSHPRR